MTFTDQCLEYVNVSSLAPISNALKQISIESCMAARVSSLAPISNALKQMGIESRAAARGGGNEDMMAIPESPAGRLSGWAASPTTHSADGPAEPPATGEEKPPSRPLNRQRTDVHYELSSASHVVINPTQPKNLGELKLKRTSFTMNTKAMP